MESGDGVCSLYQQHLPLWAGRGMADFKPETGKADAIFGSTLRQGLPRSDHAWGAHGQKG